MSQYDFRFRTISEYNYTYATPVLWQAWHEAFFNRVGSVLNANGEWIRLHTAGCTTDSWTTPNCTRTCGNATAMFSSPENVWNCMALATVTMEVVGGNKTVDPDNLKAMDDIFHLGGSLDAFDGLHVFAGVRQCFWQSCSDSKYGSCTPGLQRFRCDPIDATNIADFAAVIDRPYCQDAGLGIDSDIAGPGILVSYVIQIALVLLFAAFFWSTYQPWTRLRSAVRELRDNGSASKRPGPPEGTELAPPDTLDLEPAGNFAVAVHSAVSDLQDAQTAFGLTIAVIFLCAFGGAGDLGLANVTSVFSYTMNRDIAFGLLVVGTCSVVFLQPCRQRVGKGGTLRAISMVPMVASWLLLIVAHGTRDHGSWANPQKFIKNLRDNAAVEDCGNNPGPMSYCLGSQLQGPDKSQQVFKLTTALAPAVHLLSAIVLLEECIAFLGWYFDSRNGTATGRTRRSKGLQILQLCSRIFTFILLAAELLGVALLLIFTVDVGKAFKMIEQINGGVHSWGFGQLAATAIWIPVVTSFVTFLVGTSPSRLPMLALITDLEMQSAVKKERKQEYTANSKCPGREPLRCRCQARRSRKITVRILRTHLCWALNRQARMFHCPFFRHELVVEL